MLPLYDLFHVTKYGDKLTEHTVIFVQVQDVVPITSCDTAGSFLLLGCNNGSIYYIGKPLTSNRCMFTG